MEKKVEMCYFDREQSVNGDGQTKALVIPYIVFGVTTEDEALELAYNTVAKKYDDIDLDSIEIDSRLAEEIFKVKANYPEPSDSNTNGDSNTPSFSFDTSGGTKHLSQSPSTVASYPANAPSFNGAINVDEKGNIGGVDVTMPMFSFTETHFYSNSKVSNSFKRELSELTGKVNNSSFKGWSAGEVLFMGASGTRRGKRSKDKWEVTFKFSVSPNVKNLKVGDITVASKDGWDYLWVKYGPEVNLQNRVLIRKPKYVYVERVYERASFSALD